MKKQQLKLEDFDGALAVMDNYLFGAIADYENGDVENTNCIEGCIHAMKLIYSLTEPLLATYGDVAEYERRFLDAKTRKISKQ